MKNKIPTISIQIRIPVELDSKIAEIGEKQFKTRSQIIRDCLGLFFAKNASIESFNKLNTL